jgi:16S rRNA (guanine527-N7)-methyltransferase
MRFKEIFSAQAGAFGIDLDDAAIDRLEAFYDLVELHNPLLHLVAPCSTEEFIVRHVLESLTLLEFLPIGSTFADIGPGAGFPSIPCLLVRPDLRAVLIESKIKKTGYLSEAIQTLGLSERVSVINRQFEETSPDGVDFVTCRALDKFAEKLPRMIRWAKGRSLRLFGGPAISRELVSAKIKFVSKLMPMSEQRYLFICASSVKRHGIDRKR